jgi:RNA polymerase sigma factor (sigma-70 family)
MSSDALPALETMPASDELTTTLDRVLREHGPALRRVARIYEWDASRSEDLFQDICVAIWRALPSFRGESSERTFVFRIAHNRGLTHRTRRAPPDKPIDEAVDIAGAAPDPDATIYRQQQRAALAAAVRELPVALAQVLTLALEGLSQREIAEVLGITENNVAVRANRARGRVKAILAARHGRTS